MLAFLDSILNQDKRARVWRYLLLTLGEVILIIVGILIALRFEESQKIAEDRSRLDDRLEALRSELIADVQQLQSQDATYAILEQNAELIIEAFFSATKVSDLDLLDSIQYIYWDDLLVSTSIYDELVATGLIYKIKDKKLKRIIVEYYEEVVSTRKFIWLINESQLTLQSRKELYPYLYLKSILHKEGIAGVDTSWIGNPKHPTYLAIAYHLNTNQFTSNLERRRFFQSLIAKATGIINFLDQMDRK